MKRFFAVLMMLLLPFQMTLAAVVAIEMGAASPPLQMQGEEECHHQATMALGASDDMSADSSHVNHGNCGICHFSCCSALPIASAITPVYSANPTPDPTPEAQPPAPPAARPERPNWADLA